jgi:2',3'-cyclic-nucleotide 2'-phosphodiesterase (5'-nucleotidase family)
MAGFYVSAKYYIELPELTDEAGIIQTQMDIEALSSVNAEGDLVFNDIAYACNEIIAELDSDN